MNNIHQPNPPNTSRLSQTPLILTPLNQYKSLTSSLQSSSISSSQLYKNLTSSMQNYKNNLSQFQLFISNTLQSDKIIKEKCKNVLGENVKCLKENFKEFSNQWKIQLPTICKQFMDIVRKICVVYQQQVQRLSQINQKWEFSYKQLLKNSNNSNVNINSIIESKNNPKNDNAPRISNKNNTQNKQNKIQNTPYQIIQKYKKQSQQLQKQKQKLPQNRQNANKQQKMTIKQQQSSVKLLHHNSSNNYNSNKQFESYNIMDYLCKIKQSQISIMREQITELFQQQQSSYRDDNNNEKQNQNQNNNIIDIVNNENENNNNNGQSQQQQQQNINKLNLKIFLNHHNNIHSQQQKYKDEIKQFRLKTISDDKSGRNSALNNINNKQKDNIYGNKQTFIKCNSQQNSRKNSIVFKQQFWQTLTNNVSIKSNKSMNSLNKQNMNNSIKQKQKDKQKEKQRVMTKSNNKFEKQKQKDRNDGYNPNVSSTRLQDLKRNMYKNKVPSQLRY